MLLANNRKRIIEIGIILLGVAAAAVMIFLTAISLAINPDQPALSTKGNMYLQPERIQATKGQEVAFVVRITPDTDVDTVTASLVVQTDELVYKSVSYKDSPFATQIPATQKNGMVTVQAAKLGGSVSSDALIASLVFVAQKSGTFTPSLSGNAARAGVATNPTIDGRVVPMASTSDTPARQAGEASANTTKSKEVAALPPVASLQRLLESAGLGASTAQKVSYGTLGILMACIIAALVLIGIQIKRKKTPVPTPMETPILPRT